MVNEKSKKASLKHNVKKQKIKLNFNKNKESTLFKNIDELIDN